MTWIRRTIAAAVAVGLLAAGCGRGTDESSVTTIGLLSAALADTAEASSYRVTLSGGLTLKISGVELTAALDEQNPLAVGEVSPEREHFKINIGTLLESLFEPHFESLPFDREEVAFEVWADDERLVIDTSALQQLADVDSDVDMGPLTPGVSFIDIAVLEAESIEFMDAVSGTSTPDLSELAVSLPLALVTIKQTSTDPPAFVGTTTSARLSEAMGSNIEADARSVAVELGMALPADFDELTEIVVQVYETNKVEVVIELDERGLLSVLWTKEDYSDVFRALAESENFGTRLSEEERQEAADVMRSIESIFETRIAYEPDADLEVPLPPPTTVDRTEEWREFLAEPSF